jgi:predicted transcriptional regulator of viral defense system
LDSQRDPKPSDLTHRLLAYGEHKAGNEHFALVTSEELGSRLQITERQLVRLLARLAAQGRIQCLQRTLYLLPGKLPPGKAWKPSPYEALASYMEWLGVKWQICGIAAFARHGFSSQIPQTISVYNNKISGKKVVADSAFEFIKIPTERLGFTSTDKTSSGKIIVYSSKARAIFDAIFDQKHFSCLAEAYAWILQISKDNATTRELIKCTVAHGNIQSAARIGFILEKAGVNAAAVHKRMVTFKSSRLTTLVPGSRRGPISKRWNIIENRRTEDIFALEEIPDDDDDT